MMAWGESDAGLASATWLGRGALVERLARAADGGGMAVIAAEAGTGKTALLRQWLATRPHDGVRMADATTAAGFDAALSQLADGATVVIDQADRIDDARLERLGRAERAPAGALIVAGRRDPMLSGAQLQIAGEDLAWSPAEVAEVLHRWGRPVSDGDAEEIAWISEGWCAAVRLAAVAGAAVLREESAALHHELMREAAAASGPELLGAAIELSAVDQFDAATVDAILDPPEGGAAVIDALVRSRLFVRPTGEPGVWRFHRLFLRAARRELYAGPAAAAGRWPEHATLDPAEVSRRFLAPRAQLANLTDDMLDSELLAAHAVALLLEGALGPPSPSALVRASGGAPLGRAAIALAALAAGDLGAAEYAHDGSVDPRDPVSGELAAVSGLLRARRAGALEAAAQAAQTIAATADDGRRALAWLELGTLEADLGHYGQAEEHLELAASLADHAGRLALAARAWSALALLAASAGRLREAEERLELVDPRGAPAEAEVRAALALGLVAFQRDDLTRAADQVDEARRAVAGSWDPVLELYVLLAEIALLDADGRDALVAARLAEADAQRARSTGPVFQTTVLDLYRVRKLERSGREREAADLLGELSQRDHPVSALAVARRNILADDAAGALRALDATGLTSIWHLLLSAIAIERVGDVDAAHSKLEEALDLAEAEGLRRPFVDEGLPARALLADHLQHTTAHAAFISDLLDRIDARRPAPDGQLRSRLTERETVVLGYLPSEMTARDIADALTVSETTVRTHLHHIYGKLDADGRRDAVRRARELRLLSPQ